MASFFFFPFFYFPLPLSQNVRNKYFNSKWHCGALQRCGPGRVPGCLRCFSRRRGVQPFGKHSHAREVPEHCRAWPPAAIRQAGYTLKHTKNRRFSWLGALLGNLHAVSDVLAREKDIKNHFRDNFKLFQVFWVRQ